jgi:hypothetical protein
VDEMAVPDLVVERFGGAGVHGHGSCIGRSAGMNIKNGLPLKGFCRQSIRI